MWDWFSYPSLVSLWQVLGLEVFLGTSSRWPALFWVTLVPAALQSVLLPFCPESPRFLYLVCEQESQARTSEWPATLQSLCCVSRPSP